MPPPSPLPSDPGFAGKGGVYTPPQPRSRLAQPDGDALITPRRYTPAHYTRDTPVRYTRDTPTPAPAPPQPTPGISAMSWNQSALSAREAWGGRGMDNSYPASTALRSPRESETVSGRVVSGPTDTHALVARPDERRLSAPRSPNAGVHPSIWASPRPRRAPRESRAPAPEPDAPRGRALLASDLEVTYVDSDELPPWYVRRSIAATPRRRPATKGGPRVRNPPRPSGSARKRTGRANTGRRDNGIWVYASKSSLGGEKSYNKVAKKRLAAASRALPKVDSGALIANLRAARDKTRKKLYVVRDQRRQSSKGSKRSAPRV